MADERKTTLISDVTGDGDSGKELQFLPDINADGPFSSKMREHLMDVYHRETATVDGIMKQGCEVLKYFANPSCEEKTEHKILCIGKVQSGKTTFFLSAASYAFDNGIDIVFLLGGTKKNLLDQNIRRLEEAFENNPQVKIYEAKGYGTDWDFETVDFLIRRGSKVIIASLKQGAESTNIGKLALFVEAGGKEFPTLIIDDEGDEQSLGSRAKNARNAIPKRLRQAMEPIRSCTYLAITATPQANLLVSTLDDLSPDFAYIVKPGRGYIGLEDYLSDDGDGFHVKVIVDEDDLLENQQMPQSLQDALAFFISACAIKQLENREPKRYSMMIHTSFKQFEHGFLKEMVFSELRTMARKLNSDADSLREVEGKFIAVLTDYRNEYGESRPIAYGDDEFIVEVGDIIGQIGCYEINSANPDEAYREEAEGMPYRIYVGGEMLGRGLTIKNLCVSYFLRDSKNPQVDTVYQRARWLGYKASYFDICRVYLSRTIYGQFQDIRDHERELLAYVGNFLATTKGNIKEMKRLFSLSSRGDYQMSLTRKSIAKTVPCDEQYFANRRTFSNKSFDWADGSPAYNRDLLKDFLTQFASEGKMESFAENSAVQTHWIARNFSYRKLFEEFLSLYAYPLHMSTGSCSGKFFKNIYEDVLSGALEDQVNVIVMRPESHEKRRPTSNSFEINNLFQGRDSSTGYPGDLYLEEFSNFKCLQIHLVHVRGINEEFEDYYPMLAFSNPMTQETVRRYLVTGDNYYGE